VDPVGAGFVEDVAWVELPVIDAPDRVDRPATIAEDSADKVT